MGERGCLRLPREIGIRPTGSWGVHVPGRRAWRGGGGPCWPVASGDHGWSCRPWRRPWLGRGGGCGLSVSPCRYCWCRRDLVPWSWLATPPVASVGERELGGGQCGQGCALGRPMGWVGGWVSSPAHASGPMAPAKAPGPTRPRARALDPGGGLGVCWEGAQGPRGPGRAAWAGPWGWQGSPRASKPRGSTWAGSPCIAPRLWVLGP